MDWYSLKQNFYLWTERSAHRDKGDRKTNSPVSLSETCLTLNETLHSIRQHGHLQMLNTIDFNTVSQ